MICSSKFGMWAKTLGLLWALGVGSCVLFAGRGFADERPAACTKPSDVEIVQLLNGWRAALMTGRPEQIAALYAPDATLIATRDGKAYKGRDAIRSFYKDFLAKHAMSSIRPANLSGGCGKAMVSGPVIYRATGRRKGTRVLYGGEYSVAYARAGGKWEIVRHSLAADPRAIGDPFDKAPGTKVPGK